jgi:hypothetical protein
VSDVICSKSCTSKVEQLRAAGDEWDKATEGRRTVQPSVVCCDRDEPGRHFIVVFFDSYEEAMKNSALPETDALAKEDDGPLRHSTYLLQPRCHRGTPIDALTFPVPRRRRSTQTGLALSAPVTSRPPY